MSHEVALPTPEGRLGSALRALAAQRSVLVTGPWGCGRSHLLRSVVAAGADAVEVVDDAHLVGDAEAQRLAERLRSGALLVLSVPDGHRLAPVLRRALDLADPAVVAVTALTASRTRDVAAERSGREVTGDEAESLHRWTGGVPALLGAAVDDLADAGWAQGSSPGPAVRDRVTRLLHSLPTLQARALTTVMSVGSLPVLLADRVLPPSAVDALQAQGILVERDEGEVADLVPVAELLGHWESWVTTRGRRDLLRRLAARVTPDDVARLGLRQRVRLAGWVLDGAGDVELVRQGVRPAMLLGDPEAAARLGRGVLASDPDDDLVRDLVVSALEADGEHAEAALVARPDSTVSPRRAANVYLTTRDEEAAHELARASGEGTDDGGEGAANLAWLQVFTGDVVGAGATTSALVAAPTTSAQARVWATVLNAVSDVVSGGGPACLELLDVGHRFVSRHEDTLTPYSAFQVAWTRCLALVRLGEGMGVEAPVMSALSETEDSQLRAAWHGVGGLAARETGRFERGAEHFDAIGDILSGDPFGLGTWAASEHAVCRAMTGVAGTAPEQAGAIGFTEAVVARNAAWCRAHSDVDGAATLAASAAELARGHGQVTDEVLALVDLARFGRTTRAATLVADVRRVDNPLVRAGGLVISAMARQRPGELVAAARTAATVGWPLVHDELLAKARARLLAEGRPTEATRLELVSGPATWRTPILGAQAPWSLTPREREIGRLAADGSSSAAVAEHLGVSRRTVDNLLGRVYLKCGISGRGELVDLVTSTGP